VGGQSVRAGCGGVGGGMIEGKKEGWCRAVVPVFVWMRLVEHLGHGVVLLRNRGAGVTEELGEGGRGESGGWASLLYAWMRFVEHLGHCVVLLRKEKCRGGWLGGGGVGWGGGGLPF
jgi:hypothetical protein